MTLSKLPADPTQRRFEDYPVGAVFEFGSESLSQESILAFARQYDPQDMHTDLALADAGPFGGLIASGWQTGSLMMRMLAEHYLPKNGLASPGIDELRWPRPVRPGDTLSLRITITDARRSQSKPDRGVVHSLVEVLNQHREPVMTLRPISFIRSREQA